MIQKPFTVIVPASTSNLGSGFDTISAALNLYLRVDVEPHSGGRIEWIKGWDSAQENILDRSLRNTLALLEVRGPGMRLSMDNPIPLKRGLGSSAAAIIAGIRIAEHVAGVRLSQEKEFEMAYPLEGHPDNLSASLLGGWTLSWVQDEKIFAEKLSSSFAGRFVIAIPEMTVSTREARAILPESYSRGAAVFNLQRCALLVHALYSGRKGLLREATRDRLHQPYRSSLVPGISRLLNFDGLDQKLVESVLAVSISGSGSAVIALADENYEEIGGWMVQTFSSAGTMASFRILDLDAEGAKISTD